MRWICDVRLVALIVGATGVACNAVSGNWYSGDFRVENESDLTVIVHDWVGFGRAMPLRGCTPPGAMRSAEFPKLDRYPDSCVVHWSDEATEERFTQKVELRGVVPKGIAGTTVFTFTDEQKWAVHFERDGGS